MQPSDENTTPGDVAEVEKPEKTKKKKNKPEPYTGPTCGQCRFWVSGGEEVGDCYRFPPRVEFDDDEGFYTLIRPPATRDERACGEFRGAN
jgi:hypothetical protein